MLKRFLATLSLGALLAWAGQVRAGEVQPADDPLDAPTRTLELNDEDGEIALVHRRFYGGYGRGFYGGYGRGFYGGYGRGFYGRSFYGGYYGRGFYGHGYYRPYYAYNYYRPYYYGYGYASYYQPYYYGYGYASYYQPYYNGYSYYQPNYYGAYYNGGYYNGFYGCSLAGPVNVASLVVCDICGAALGFPSVQQSPQGAPSVAPPSNGKQPAGPGNPGAMPRVPADNGKQPDTFRYDGGKQPDTFRYDGGPQDVVPMPENRVPVTPAPAANPPRPTVPLKGHLVSLPGNEETSGHTFRAYGEQPFAAPPRANPQPAARPSGFAYQAYGERQPQRPTGFASER